MRLALILPAPVLGTTTLSHSPRPDCTGVPAPRGPYALPNDNRDPAGTMANGVLTIRLVAQPVGWYPEGRDGCGVDAHAFAEEGKAAQVPGPLIRVPVGTEVRVILRNALGESLRVRGLVERRAEWQTVGVVPAQTIMDSTAITLADGEVREIRFRVGVAGNFYYWGIGATDEAAGAPFRNPRGRNIQLGTGRDGQLVGAIIVDPEGGSPPDRVFVLTHWRPFGGRSTSDPATAREVNAINGLSWPHSERLGATVGDTIRWRVLNPAATAHTMHLHGFFFRVLSHGGESAWDSILSPAQHRLVVSEFMSPNRTMSMEWVPERAGNWLFHCHFLMHMSPDQRIDRVFRLAPVADSHVDHATRDMAGPILAIAVNQRVGMTTPAPETPRRTLRLFANERPRVFGELPGLGFILQEGRSEPARDSVRIPGTPIVLTRGEPTQITVFNRLRVPLAVHWHGMELDSWFDGVPDFSGQPGRTRPAVAPGDSFAVHMTPPRAGTFIYHIHSEQNDELNSGLYGPLIVLKPGDRWRPETDHVVVLSNGGPGDSHDVIFVNGTTTPEPLQVRVGEPQRLRVIAIPANGEYTVQLRDRETPVRWRQIARDGADLPPQQIAEAAAITRVDVGITKDFEFTPTAIGELVLIADHRVPGHPTRLPIRVLPRVGANR